MILHAIGESTHLFCNSGKITAVDILSVHLHAFTEVLKVRRGVEPHAVPRRPENGIQHGAGGAFAVASGHVDELQPLLGISQGLQQSARTVKAQPGGAPGVIFNICDGFLSGHGHLLNVLNG